MFSTRYSPFLFLHLIFLQQSIIRKQFTILYPTKWSSNDQFLISNIKKKWYISLDYPKTLKLDRRNEKWASLGRRNPVRPESIGNKLWFGSNGPRTQVCSNANSTRRVAIKWCRSQRPYSFSNNKNIYVRKFYPILFYYFKSYFINYIISFYNTSNILTFISLFYSLK